MNLWEYKKQGKAYRFLYELPKPPYIEVVELYHPYTGQPYHPYMETEPEGIPVWATPFDGDLSNQYRLKSGIYLLPPDTPVPENLRPVPVEHTLHYSCRRKDGTGRPAPLLTIRANGRYHYYTPCPKDRATNILVYL